MSKAVEKSVPDSTETPVSKSKTSKEIAVKMDFMKFIKTCKPKTDKYIRAYYEPVYSGILKTEDEWNKELDAKIQGGEN